MNHGPGRFDTDIDLEAIRESEREACAREAEVSRDVWDGVGRGRRDRSWYIAIPDRHPVHVRAAGDEYAIVERFTGHYDMWLVDTAGMGLHEFHVTVVERVADGETPTAATGLRGRGDDREAGR